MKIMFNLKYSIMWKDLRKFFWSVMFIFLSSAICLPVEEAYAQQLASLHSGTSELYQDKKELKEILTELESRYQIQFNYVRTTIEGKFVNDNLDSMSGEAIDEIVSQVLKPLNLTYEKVGKNLFIIFSQKEEETMILNMNRIMPEPMANVEKTASLKPILQLNDRFKVMEQTISGKVSDLETGEGLPGVNILAKSTTTGTVSDMDGNYRITVADEVSTLVFSSIGYETEEVQINGRSTINLSLSPDIQSLSEVVVVGYGTVKKSDLTGSVSSVKSEELTAYPAQGTVQALQGRAAGVNIQSNNGAPGAGLKVRIRGGTSINASSDPIYVVDGFVGAALPPPEDIESIEVLKDASATAIYGSRGANGVIMVTTKRGKSGEVKIDFNASYSAQNEINRLDLLNADQFADYIQEARPGIAPGDGETDWQDEIFRTGGIQNYQLSLSGGNESVNYYVSGSYFDQKGVIVNSAFDRFSLTSNIDIKASEKFRMGLNLFAQRNTTDGVRTQEGSGGLTPGVVSSTFKFEPDRNIYNPDGSFTIARLNDPIDNPYAIATQLQDESVNDRFQANVYAEYDIFKDLKFRTTFGATTNNGRRGRYSPTTLQEGRNAGGGDARVDGSKNTLLLNENYLTYSKSFGQIHNLSVMAGYSFQSSSSEDWGGRSQSFINDSFSFWGLGSGSVYQAPNSGLTEWQIASYYGRLNYSLLDRYLLTFNARYDGASNFSRNNKWAFFPSGALAWNMKEEQFMQDVNWLSFWKWRVSYGLTGNQAIGPYQTLARFSPVYSVIGGQSVNAARPTEVANEILSWETTAQFDIGADIGFLDDRINLTVDYYSMVTSDLLFEVRLPQYTGYPEQLKNLGKVENKGWEAMISSRNLTGEFQWTTNLNVSANRNKVLSLPDGNDIFYSSAPGHMVGLGDTQILREGYAVGTFFGWMYDGVYQEGDDFVAGGGFEQEAGGEKFMDIYGRDEEGNLTDGPDGTLNSDDRTIIGNPNPDFIWGFNNDFKWRNFDLNIFFQGSQGNDILSYTLMELNLLSGINNATTEALDRWTPSNTNTDIPKASSGRTRRVSTRWIYDGSYIRLKNLALGYTLPQTVLDRLNLERLRIYVSAQNILTFTDYPGYDPEVNYQTSGGQNGNRNLGLDYGSYPNAKSYTVGLNIGF
ncbi:SusC/RagA family TonB-linked outer membrane protein [Catalinimonas niigatensis]|uniref:SusC/RagA family TonB-linked outer membrane protein n=1 Tax=Catalinimonas niigatensis TaxID=1397264 RepID=UPI002666F824|nr:TonB-dependent receptor [Catalinimonas niigatensis]WPP50961.1 TonB-dependent receptor [Catalinimonas niigatensis]